MRSLTGEFCITGQSVRDLLAETAPSANLTAVESLFAGPVLSYVLTSAGNIPVDRKTKDRRKLFAGTMEALANGAAVALFPEGTSYTEPRIMQVKDGAAWAALEYTKWSKEQGNGAQPVRIVPTAIVYTDKSKYRSRVSNSTMSQVSF